MLKYCKEIISKKEWSMRAWMQWMGVSLSFVLVCGCASGSVKEMSAKDEARYAAAIEKSEAEHPSAIQEDTRYVVAVGEGAAAQAGAELQMPQQEQNAEVSQNDADAAPARTFSVSRPMYDTFFAQSPAVILGRMTLDPIVDGGVLLGYRVKDLKAFSGVDLADDDIIIGINGQLPKTPDDYFNRWEEAKNGSGCTVNIQRGMTKFDLIWTVE